MTRDRIIGTAAAFLVGCNLFTATPGSVDDPSDASPADLGRDGAVADAANSDVSAPSDVARVDQGGDLEFADGSQGRDDMSGTSSSVQTGALVMIGQLVSEVMLDHAVDRDRSALVFSMTSDADAPSRAQVVGELVDATTVRFTRARNGANVEIRWYVVELDDAAVQHVLQCNGTAFVTCSTPNIATDPVVTPISTIDVTRTFVFGSQLSSGDSFDRDDFAEVRLAATTLSGFYDGSGDGGAVAGEVVSMPGARVQAASTTMPASSASVTGSLVPVDTDRTFALVTWRVIDEIGRVGPYALRARLQGSSIVVERLITGGELDLTWYVVELPPGYLVQSGDVDMDGTTTTVTQGIAPVPLDRSFVFLSGNQHGAATAYRGASMDPYSDSIGAARMTVELVESGDATASAVRLHRSLDADSPAAATYFVVTLP